MIVSRRFFARGNALFLGGSNSSINKKLKPHQT